MSLQSTWNIWRCDGCGKTEQMPHGEWAEADLPARWFQAFGFNVHACCAKCRNDIEAKHLDADGKRFLWHPNTAKRWPGMLRTAG